MLLGLMSDTHDNEARLQAGLDVFEARDVDAILHMGDLVSPGTVDHLEGWTARIVRGNMDVDIKAIEAAAERLAGDVRYGDEFRFSVDDTEIALHHGHEARLGQLIDGGFDLVCHGHTHTFRDETIGGTRVVNPGALHRSSEPSVCVYDTGDDALERIRV